MIITFGDFCVDIFIGKKKKNIKIFLSSLFSMKINEKTLYAFASSKPVDREGFLNKRGEGKHEESLKASKREIA